MRLHCPIPYIPHIHRLMFYTPSPKNIVIFNLFRLFREDIEHITSDFSTFISTFEHPIRLL